MLKSLIRKGIGALGYELTPKSKAKDVFVPYLQAYNLMYKGAKQPCRFDFWLANRAAEQWYKEWFFQADNPNWELDEFSWLIAPGDRILEIGCHHGFLTMMLAHCVGEKGFILALDANPENAMIAQAQVALNNLGKTCKVMNLAGAETPDKLQFSWQTNSHMVANDAPQKAKKTYEIMATTGDLLDAEYGQFNVLKIDVEGFEFSVLKGCKNILNRKPKLILELHPMFMQSYGYGHTLNDIFNLLEIENYAGTMVVRPNFSQSLTFDPAQVPTDIVSNVHLRAK